MNDDHVTLKVLEREVQHVNRKLDELAVTVNKITAQLANSKPCPAPGSCLELSRRLEEIEDRVEVVTEAMNKAIGGAKVLIFVGGLFGSIFGFFGKTLWLKIWG